MDEGEGRLWAESRGFHYFETSAQSGEGINEMFQVWTLHASFSPLPPLKDAVLNFASASQAFFSSITDMCENGGKRPVSEVSVGFTKEQADTIRRIRNSKDSWDMLGVKPGATRSVRVELGVGLTLKQRLPFQSPAPLLLNPSYKH